MFSHDHLTLRLVRLKGSEEWAGCGDGISFVFVKGGSGKCVLGTTTQHLEPGDVLVSDAGSNGKVCVPEKGQMVFWSFSLCMEHLFPLFGSSEVSLLQDVMADFKSTKRYPASDGIAKECHKFLEDVPPQSGLDHRGQLLRVVATILTQEFKQAHEQRIGFVRVEDHMTRIFEKLSVTELLSLSVGDLAAKFGCSRRHLNRLFHQHFGFSVAALRMEMRLLKAVSLLRDPDGKIINVAEKCGFNHLGLFNSCFKRRFGASPGQWRKSTMKLKSGMVSAENLGCPLRIKGLCPLPYHPDDPKPGSKAAFPDNGAARSDASRAAATPASAPAQVRPAQPKTASHQPMPRQCVADALC